MFKAITMLMAFGVTTISFAGGADDPLVYKVMIDKLELRDADGSNPIVLDADAWVGYDLNKVWFKTEVEHVDGDTEEAELQLLYSRAIAPFWDVQVGWRRDIKPEPDRDYFAFGLKGLAPYLFEVDASLFFGESGQVGIRLDVEYEYMFSQKLILSPEMEVNYYSKDDKDVGIGSGFSDMAIGLRLRYEIRREFAPYIGINWSKKLGQTADFAKEEGEDDDDIQIVVGFRAWF